MSFREKSAWTSLLATLVVFVPYFREIFSRFAQGDLSPAVALGGFIGASIYITVLSIVAEIAIGILSRPATTDERDMAIAARSYKTGYYALMGGSGPAPNRATRASPGPVRPPRWCGGSRSPRPPGRLRPRRSPERLASRR